MMEVFCERTESNRCRRMEGEEAQLQKAHDEAIAAAEEAKTALNTYLVSHACSVLC